VDTRATHGRVVEHGARVEQACTIRPSSLSFCGVDVAHHACSSPPHTHPTPHDVRPSVLQVCFPGGMADRTDRSIVDTALRETHEEIGLVATATDVLGVLRCDWTQVEAITGTPVTPVVGFVGDLEALELRLNPDEVGGECGRRGRGGPQQREQERVCMGLRLMRLQRA
jgi:hypothetical protein